MNKNQVQSIIRQLLNLLSGGIVAYTASKSQPAKDLAGFLVQFINGPDALALAMAGVAWLWGHLTHSTPGNNDSGTPPTSGGGARVALFLVAGLLLTGSGCSTTAQRVAYQSAGTTAVTVETALHAYDVFAAQGKTTPAQNAQVKVAYQKYQAAFAVVCDAGAIYAAAGTTNAPAASAALSQAVANAGATLADLENLIKSFGVTF